MHPPLSIVLLSCFSLRWRYSARSPHLSARLSLFGRTVQESRSHTWPTALHILPCPRLILGVVVGGTQLAAAANLLAKRRAALLLSAIAGFGMLIWIFAELAIIRQYSWLQTAYFALGLLEVMLVLTLLGIAPTLVGPLDAPDDRGP